MKHPFRLFLAAASFALTAAFPALAIVPHIPKDAAYPYGGPVFTSFIANSDQCTGEGTPAEFYRWMDQAPLAQQSHGLLAMADTEKKTLAALPTPSQKSAQERVYCAALHHMVKTWIPRFSLDTGFEFTDAMRLGTRQCLLQSVLLSGLLQRAGIDAGMVMVWRNIAGQTTNDGHAICLVHLADGHAVELDASDPVPFVRHQGLLVDEHGLRNVAPIFEGSTTSIIGFRSTGNGRLLAVSQVQPLSAGYVCSQFYYYRGERTPGGLLASQITSAGLKQEASYLRRSIHICPENELSVYMLGHVLLRQGKLAAARYQVAQSQRLYAEAGWTPQGVRDLAEATRAPLRYASR